MGSEEVEAFKTGLIFGAICGFLSGSALAAIMIISIIKFLG